VRQRVVQREVALEEVNHGRRSEQH